MKYFPTQVEQHVTVRHKSRELEFLLHFLRNVTQFFNALIYCPEQILNTGHSISVKQGLTALYTNPRRDIQ